MPLRSPSPPPSLLSLPYDIHHALILTLSHAPTCSPTTLSSLRLTCRYFAFYIPARYLRRVRRRAIRLLARRELEDWTVWFGERGPGNVDAGARGDNGEEGGGLAYFPLYLGCFICLERLPRWRFVEAMTRGPYSPPSLQRWCKPCGSVHPTRAQPGIYYREAPLDERDRDHKTPAEPATLALRGNLACMGCAKRNHPWELLWGCGDCFRKEKRRRREVELMNAWRERGRGGCDEGVIGRWLDRKGLLDGDGSREWWEVIGRGPEGIRKDDNDLRACNAGKMQMPSRETRCMDCWLFPVRRKGANPEPVYAGLSVEFWCRPCQMLLHQTAAAMMAPKKDVGDNDHDRHLHGLRRLTSVR